MVLLFNIIMEVAMKHLNKHMQSLFYSKYAAVVMLGFSLFKLYKNALPDDLLTLFSTLRYRILC